MATALHVDEYVKSVSPARVAAIEAGLPVKMLRVVMRDYDFTIADIARVLGPRRTVERRLENGERLSLDESERLARLLNMLDLGMQVFKDRAWLKEWLSNPKPALAKRVPLDLMRTEAGGRMLEDELLQLKHGFFA